MVPAASGCAGQPPPRTVATGRTQAGLVSNRQATARLAAAAERPRLKESPVPARNRGAGRQIRPTRGGLGGRGAVTTQRSYDGVRGGCRSK
jgi:hypothetical protein